MTESEQAEQVHVPKRARLCSSTPTIHQFFKASNFSPAEPSAAPSSSSHSDDQDVQCNLDNMVAAPE
jgi:hypothetical protein